MTTGYSLQDIGLHHLLSTRMREDTDKKIVTMSNLAGPLWRGAGESNRVGCKCSNSKCSEKKHWMKILSQWPEELKVWVLLWGGQPQILKEKRHLISFLLVHLVGTQACIFALRAHDGKRVLLGGRVMELNTLLNPIW